MGEPVDLDAIAPRGESVPFTFRGVSYVLPAPVTWPVEVMTAMTRGDMTASLTAMLGSDAAERLVSDGLTMGHLTALFEIADGQRGR